MKVYAVDIDGVLDIKENVTKVNMMYEDPESVIILHTSRSSKIRIETEEYLYKLGVKYHSLVMDKLRADHYIDDKNLEL